MLVVLRLHDAEFLYLDKYLLKLFYFKLFHPTGYNYIKTASFFIDL